ncbi:hypothetical protein CDAR_430091 [Caerostris darwini]|uniref:Uncharacterized protein n=1 Tax=Caerostris darwini TaxID=1538125 RepID=A0AAV4WF26_9ARAC|nr:hypothetical protein CDAR_430091 [Caerostris darwini]
MINTYLEYLIPCHFGWLGSRLLCAPPDLADSGQNKFRYLDEGPWCPANFFRRRDPLFIETFPGEDDNRKNHKRRVQTVRLVFLTDCRNWVLKFWMDDRFSVVFLLGLFGCWTLFVLELFSRMKTSLD